MILHYAAVARSLREEIAATALSASGPAIADAGLRLGKLDSLRAFYAAIEYRKCHKPEGDDDD